MLSRTVHPNILNHSLWWGSCSLCFWRVNSGSSMAEELVRGTRRTLPSADCCRLYSYGEYWFPSGSRRCCRMTYSSVAIPLLFCTYKYVQVKAILLQWTISLQCYKSAVLNLQPAAACRPGFHFMLPKDTWHQAGNFNSYENPRMGGCGDKAI